MPGNKVRQKCKEGFISFCSHVRWCGLHHPGPQLQPRLVPDEEGETLAEDIAPDTRWPSNKPEEQGDGAPEASSSV